MFLKFHRSIVLHVNGIFLAVLLSSVILSAEVPREQERGAIPRREVEPDPVLLCEVRNLYRVAPGIYRSAQPDGEEFRTLHRAGLKSVLNLRAHHSDREKIGDLPLNLCELPMNADSLTKKDLFMALVILRDVPKPVLIHCWHGSDRTGAVVAAFRIVFQNQTVESALNELKDRRYGHHRFLYRNIPELLREIDWKSIRESIRKRKRTDSASFRLQNPDPLPAGDPVRK